MAHFFEFLDNGKVKLSATSKLHLTLALDLMMHWVDEEENITLNIEEANMTVAPFHQRKVKPLAYTLKGCTPVEDLPVPNAYTNSFVVCSCIICISI